MNEVTRRRVSFAATLVALNILVHFVPFERPGFQPDDYVWRHLSTDPSTGAFNTAGLTQGIRPLGSTLFMAIPFVFGLNEPAQLAILIATTSLLTVLAYLYLDGLLGESTAALASLIFVLWPVKHELYGSQLMAVVTTAGCLILAAGLTFRRWMQRGERSFLLAAVLLYTASILTYEIGYLAPLVFYWFEREGSEENRRGAALFAIPAVLYWILRWARPEAPFTIGRHDLSLDGLADGLVSLPSNLLGFQAARNMAYGLFGVWSASTALQAFAAAIAAVVALLSRRLRRRSDENRETLDSSWWRTTAGALGVAVLLMAPAAMVLVESRQSVLSAIAMGVALCATLFRLPRMATAGVAALLAFASMGLAFRQAQLSAIQAAVASSLTTRAKTLELAETVVIDLETLSSRIDYTWGDARTNGLRSYWGLPAFGPGGFAYMVEDAVSPMAGTKRRRVLVCAAGLSRADGKIRCEREIRGRRFEVRDENAVIVDFSSLPLPDAIARRPPAS